MNKVKNLFEDKVYHMAGKHSVTEGCFAALDVPVALVL